MWKKNRCSLLALLMVLFSFGRHLAGAQAADWKTKTLDGGKLEVSSRISEIVDQKGYKAALIEYRASLIDSIDMKRCVALVKDIPSQSRWLDGKYSEEVAEISPKEWIVYHRFKGEGPIPESDCIVAMSLEEDAEKSSATFTFKATPEACPMRDVARFSIYDMTLTFIDLEDGKTSMVTTAKISPAMKIPLWMIKMGFPDAAGDTLRGIVALVRE